MKNKFILLIFIFASLVSPTLQADEDRCWVSSGAKKLGFAPLVSDGKNIMNVAHNVMVCIFLNENEEGFAFNSRNNTPRFYAKCLSGKQALSHGFSTSDPISVGGISLNNSTTTGYVEMDLNSSTSNYGTSGYLELLAYCSL